MSSAVKTKTTAIITIAVTLAILVVINLLSLNLFARWDMTENKIYSISETSKDIIANLQDRLTVKVFFSEDLPAPHNTDRRYLQDILDDFRAYSGGNMEYEFIDPISEEGQQEAQSYRLQPVRFDIRGTTKAEQRLGYKAVVLLYGGKQEVMPFIMSTNNFEYDFIRLVKKLASNKIPRIGFAYGFGETPLRESLTFASQVLEQDFETVPLDLRNLEAIPLDIEVLMIIAPTKKYSDRALYLIDQYIMRGGKVAFLYNDFKINEVTGTIDEIDIGLDKLLENYGIGLHHDYVIDRNSYRYTNLKRVEGGIVPETIQVPHFINVVNFNPNNIVSKNQKTMSLVGTSSLDTSMQVPSGVEREILFTSSEQSGTITGDINRAYQTINDSSSYNQSYLPLGAVLSGQFPSYFSDKPIPSADSTDTNFMAPSQEKIQQSAETRLLVPIAVLVILLIAYFIVKNQKSSSIAPERQANYLNLIPDMIDRVVIDRDGKLVELLKKPEGWFVMVDSQPRLANSAQVSEMLSMASDVEVGAVESENPRRQALYQVDTASGALVRFYEDDRLMSSVIVGKNAQVPDYSYIRKPGLNKVYRAKNMRSYLFNKPVNGWRDKTIAQIDTSSLASINFRYPDRSFTLTRSDSLWNLNVNESKTRFAVDRDTIAQYKRLLADLKTDDFFVLPRDSAFNIDNFEPYLIIDIRYLDGNSEVLKVYNQVNEEKRYYLTTSNRDDVFVLYSTKYGRLARKIDNFRAVSEKNG